MDGHRRSVLPVLAWCAALPLLAAAVRAVPDQRPGQNLLPSTPAQDSLARRVRQDDGGIVLIPAPKLSPTSSPAPASAAMDASPSASNDAVLQRPLFGPSPSWASGASLASGFAPSSGPKSYSYMVLQPHPRTAGYRRHKSTRVTLDSQTRAVDHMPRKAAHKAHKAPKAAGRPFALDHFEERPPFTGHTFQSFPFGAFHTPSSFTHGNPLAGFHRRPADGDLGGGPERPIASITLHGANHAPPRLQRPRAFKAAAKKRPSSSAMEIGSLGDPRRPNLGIVGVPGQQGVDEPSSPLVREYDPYTGRFRVVSTDEGHDSREAYRRPGASSEEDSQLADVPLESYEVYERPEETPSVVAAPMPASMPMRGSSCRQSQRDLLAGLLAPLLNSMRPTSQSKCQAGTKSERFASLHRPRAPPRRKQVKQRMKQQRAKQQQQREPYFEFRNPVHSYISGAPEPRGRALGDDDDDAERSLAMLEHAVDHDMHDDAEYLTMGDGERAAKDDAEEQRLLGGRGDENVFAPYSVYRTVLEPDKQFKPSVRYPFEEERANLKDLVEQLG